MDIQFKEGIQAEITCVPNAFIDELLAEANGDYVRVYLYLLRHCKENMKVHSVADSLNLTDRDITRAISYWEKKGIFKEGTAGVVEEEIRNEEAARLSEANLEMKELPSGEKVISPKDKTNPKRTTQSKFAGCPPLVISAKAKIPKETPKRPRPNAVCLKIVNPPFGLLASISQSIPRIGPRAIHTKAFKESKKEVGTWKLPICQFIRYTSFPAS